MRTILKIIREGALQSWQSLVSNKLRSFLSLLGITIGIFCIVGVRSAVDSLEANVRGSFEKLGRDVIYVSKFTWAEDPGQNYWKFMRRPNISYDDYESIARRVKTAALVSYHVFIGSKTAKWKSNSVERTFMLGCTYDYDKMFNLKFVQGRWFSQSEYQHGTNLVVLGAEVAEGLFGQNVDPINKLVRIGGRPYKVIGVLERNGKDLINIMNFDNALLTSYEMAKKVANLKARNVFGNSMLSVKCDPNVSMDVFRDDITVAMRSTRKLKPLEEENFALNELSLLSKVLDGFFAVLNSVGLFIGLFAIIVGIFSVANIMFVSVRERTNIIGIKKALGAKNYFILLEFLIESVFLCIMGGVLGLAIIALFAKLLSIALEFNLFLSVENIVFGLVLSTIIGILSGVIPALRAARMDPVEAIRSK